MLPMSHHDARPLLVIVLAGVVASVTVYVLSADVVLTIIPLAITVALARRLLRRKTDR